MSFVAGIWRTKRVDVLLQGREWRRGVEAEPSGDESVEQDEEGAWVEDVEGVIVEENDVDREHRSIGESGLAQETRAGRSRRDDDATDKAKTAVDFG